VGRGGRLGATAAAQFLAALGTTLQPAHVMKALLRPENWLRKTLPSAQYPPLDQRCPLRLEHVHVHLEADVGIMGSWRGLGVVLQAGGQTRRRGVRLVRADRRAPWHATDKQLRAWPALSLMVALGMQSIRWKPKRRLLLGGILDN
jgi:hypothetical protein